jgi:uncharacterized protein (TIGR02453 family)
MATQIRGSANEPARGQAPGRFAGFPDEALLFYEGLEADNSKAYWTAHKDLYEKAVQAPMLALLAALEPEFGPAKMFRPYRDVRFSADKSPYKTHAGAVTGRGHGLYVQISAEGLMVAGGYYQMARDQLARYRAAVEDDRRGTALAGITAALSGDSLTLAGEQLKRAPRGVDPDHPRLDLLRHKGLYAYRRFAPARWLDTAKSLQRVSGSWRQMGPLIEWLDREVGPTEEAHEAR